MHVRIDERFRHAVHAAPARCASGHLTIQPTLPLSPITHRQAALTIAQALSAGAPDRDNMIAFARRQVDAEPALLARLVTDTLAILGTRAVVASQADIAELMLAHPALLAAFGSFQDESEDGDEDGVVAATPPFQRPMRNSFIAAPTLTKPVLWPVPAYNLPAIDSTADLCALLEIHPQRLEAWGRRWRQQPNLSTELQQRHSAYFSYWQPKKRGGARLIEIPKPDLKQAQRRLLKRVIERVDPHEAATGFRRGHSIIDHAARHAGNEIVLKCDLQDFFVTIRASRIHVIFRHLGYCETVARALTAMVTTRASARCVAESRSFGIDFSSAKCYQSDHLPQGAPTSPALANLAAFKLDLRLASLAESAGAIYSRYADDLTFSGTRSTGVSNQRFYLRVCAIALEEGFNINARKTRLMTQSHRQHVTGLVINERANVARREFDHLKAILTNAARHGLGSQNREDRDDFRSHLLGKIAFVAQVNPARGEKLLLLWQKIDQ